MQENAGFCRCPAEAVCYLYLSITNGIGFHDLFEDFDHYQPLDLENAVQLCSNFPPISHVLLPFSFQALPNSPPTFVCCLEPLPFISCASSHLPLAMCTFIWKAVQHCYQAICNYNVFNKKPLDQIDQYSAMHHRHHNNGNGPICPYCDAEGRHYMTYEARVQHIKAWLYECSIHSLCQWPEATAPASMPTRVLDLRLDSRTQDIRLVESSTLPGPFKYAALTYCWGSPELIFKTNRANWDNNKSRIVFGNLNRLFRETITLLRSLDIQYLWIDSICIVQDDEDNRDWKKEAPKMATVYSNAFLTISAAASTRADDALFSNLTLEPHQMDPELGLTHMDQELLNCRLSKRGWCFQERCLSRRIVHFGSDLTFWECAGKTHSEHKERRPPQMHDLTPIFRLLLGPCGFHGDSTRNPYQQWYHMMWDYTLRGLTVKSDKEVAIRGLIDVFKKTTDDTWVSGLWEKDLPKGLAWYRFEDSPSVPSDNIQTSTIPSWSWLGASGNVIWPGMNSEVQSELRDVSVDKDTMSITLQGKLSSYGPPTLSDLEEFDKGKPNDRVLYMTSAIYWDRKPTPECLPSLFHPDEVDSKSTKNVWILLVSHARKTSLCGRSYGLMLVRAERPNTDSDTYQRVGCIDFPVGYGIATRMSFDELPWQTIKLR